MLMLNVYATPIHPSLLHVPALQRASTIIWPCEVLSSRNNNLNTFLGWASTHVMGIYCAVLLDDLQQLL